MKRLHWSALTISLALAIALTGCGSAPSTAPLPTPPPASATGESQRSGNSSGNATASAVVAPAEMAELAFTTSGPVKEVTVKEGDGVKAGQALITLDTPELAFSVTGAEAALRSALAEANLQKYPRKTFNGSRFVSLSGPPELREMADDKVLQAQAALEIAQASLAQGTLAAPFDGTVVSVKVTPGELVQSGQVVIVIGNLGHLQIETTDLSEREIASVQIGQTATVRLKAFEQELSGKVIAIAPMGEKSNGDIVYKVTIELDEQPQGLMWGMSAEVQIETN